MWPAGWRESWWDGLDRPRDLVVVGGGIVGAAIARQASRRGLSVVLVEQGDFSSGTSSRSSKFVHGGLRYLKNGDLRLTYESVTERRRLLRDGAGLVTPTTFLLAHYTGGRPSLATMGAVLGLYDALGRQWTHRLHSRDQVADLVPDLRQDGLTASYSYRDAQTDDSRLTLRVLSEAVRAGAAALNYVRATGLLHAGGRVAGVQLTDEHGRTAGARARVVVNATGAWADRLPETVGPRIRPLRGSHLVFDSDRLPLRRAVNFYHPADGRALTFAPWEGAVLVGTTDLDHTDGLDEEPRASAGEVDYLMTAVRHAFPALGLSAADLVSTFAGVRPVVDTGKADPTRESREHLLRYENGLLTVMGGKLTTHQVIARAALSAVAADLPAAGPPGRGLDPALDPVDPIDPTALPRAVPESLLPRLVGRYGADARALLATAGIDALDTVPGTPTTWAELSWAAGHEAVEHLDDLLLRRVRIGLLLPEGGRALLPDIRARCRSLLGWDEARWDAEERRYVQLWQRSYSPPGPPAPPELRGPKGPPGAAQQGVDDGGPS